MKSTALSVRKSARYVPFGYSTFGCVAKSKCLPIDDDRLVEAALDGVVLAVLAEVPLAEQPVA